MIKFPALSLRRHSPPDSRSAGPAPMFPRPSRRAVVSTSVTCPTRPSPRMCRHCSRLRNSQCMCRKPGGMDYAETSSERIDIAIDPFTGRNPSYCFVDLMSKELAERAMVELDGRDMLGRPIKIKPGVAKTSSERAQQRMDGSPRSDQKSTGGFDRWRRNDAPSFARSSSDSSRRLYVGGLPRLTEQDAINSNMAKFFGGYNVYVFPYGIAGRADTYRVGAGRTSANSLHRTPRSDSSRVTTTTSLWIWPVSKNLKRPWMH